MEQGFTMFGSCLARIWRSAAGAGNLPEPSTVAPLVAPCIAQGTAADDDLWASTAVEMGLWCASEIVNVHTVMTVARAARDHFSSLYGTDTPKVAPKLMRALDALQV